MVALLDHGLFSQLLNDKWGKMRHTREGNERGGREADLPVPDAEVSIFVPAVDKAVEGAPRGTGHLDISNVDGCDGLRVLCMSKGEE